MDAGSGQQACEVVDFMEVAAQATRGVLARRKRRAETMLVCRQLPGAHLAAIRQIVLCCIEGDETFNQMMDRMGALACPFGVSSEFRGRLCDACKTTVWFAGFEVRPVCRLASLRIPPSPPPFFPQTLGAQWMCAACKFHAGASLEGSWYTCMSRSEFGALEFHLSLHDPPSPVLSTSEMPCLPGIWAWHRGAGHHLHRGFIAVGHLSAALDEMNPVLKDSRTTGAELVRLARKEYIHFSVASPDTAAGALAGPRSPLLAKVMERRELEDPSIPVGFYDRYRTTLALLNMGSAHVTTRWHLDRVQAFNWAMGIGASHGDLLARWIFVPPWKAGALDEALKRIRGSEGLSDPDLDFPLPDEIETLRDILGDDGIFEVRQHAGDLVVVPPGWVHCVITVRPCLKLAWDFWDPANAARYVSSWITGAKLFCGNMATDYIDVLGILQSGLRM